MEARGDDPAALRVVDGGGQPLALAGLWAGWRDPATDTVRRTFTIITTTPNDALADLHDRMPVVVAEDAWARWLDPSPAETSELLGLLVPNEAVALDVYAVERLVNDVRRDGPELIEPLRSGVERVGPQPASASTASLQPSDPMEALNAASGLDAVVEPGREVPDERREDAVRIGIGRSNTTASGRQPIGDRRIAWHDDDRPGVGPARRIGDDRDCRAVDRVGDDEDGELGQVLQAEVDVGGLEGRAIRSGWRFGHVGSVPRVVRIVDLRPVGTW